ncbi:MAG: SMP-30/gluconolactonase/LRE family protein [Planctomycetaceae bacterium]
MKLVIPGLMALLFVGSASGYDPAPANSEAANEQAGSFEKVATGFKMAEGPVWDGERLYFTDVPPEKVLTLGSDGTASEIRSNTRWGAGLAFDSKRRLIICEVMGRRVTRVEKDGTETTLAETYEGKKLNGPNDLVVDAKDGIYFTDPLFLNRDKREQDKEAVYYITPAGKLLRVAGDMERPNGIALALDGKTLFVADTAKSRLRAYPVKEDGALGEGRDFGSVDEPDGVRVDLDGKVYAAGRNGIAVWDASGKSLGTLKTPARPSSLAFGDKDRRTMYITTKDSLHKIRIDQALKLLTADKPAESPEVVQKRVVAKIERIKEGVQKWAASGRDPSAILTTMNEKVRPRLEAGKVAEVEAELDRVLEQLNKDEK